MSTLLFLLFLGGALYCSEACQEKAWEDGHSEFCQTRWREISQAKPELIPANRTGPKFKSLSGKTEGGILLRKTWEELSSDDCHRYVEPVLPKDNLPNLLDQFTTFTLS